MVLFCNANDLDDRWRAINPTAQTTRRKCVFVLCMGKEVALIWTWIVCGGHIAATVRPFTGNAIIAVFSHRFKTGWYNYQLSCLVRILNFFSGLKNK